MTYMRLQVCVAAVCLVFCAVVSVHGSKGVRAILSVARVARHAGETRETRIYVMRDHKYYLEAVHQKQPSLQPDCKQSLGVLSDAGFQRIASLRDSPEFRSLRNSATTIGHHDGDFWYVSIPRDTGTQFVSFSNGGDHKPSAAKHLIAWVEETEKLRPLESTDSREIQCSVFSDETAEAWSH